MRLCSDPIIIVAGGGVLDVRPFLSCPAAVASISRRGTERGREMRDASREEGEETRRRRPKLEQRQIHI